MEFIVEPISDEIEFEIGCISPDCDDLGPTGHCSPDC